MPENLLVKSAAILRDETGLLNFRNPVARVYNPLVYAWEPHTAYLENFGQGEKKILFLGMNPGPWGMAQTGVPFGEIDAVRGWLKIEGKVNRPPDEHPKRPVEGFHCARSEVSGRRFWGLMKETFGTAESFFREHWVANYCPLVFMEESGRNFTPDKLSTEEREPLYRACDSHLAAAISLMKPRWLVGIGKFAMNRFTALYEASGPLSGQNPPKIGWILHPSPASPAANRGWAEAAVKQLREQGIWT